MINEPHHTSPLRSGMSGTLETEAPLGAVSPTNLFLLTTDATEVGDEISNCADYTESTLPEVFACTLCRKSYSSKSHLKRHMKMHMDAQYHCLECGKSFTWKVALTLHMRTHTKERPFRCEDCGKAFSDRSAWRRHKTCHTGEKKYLCEICGKLFRAPLTLQQHKDGIHGFEVGCKTCKARFPNKKEFREHLKNNTSHMQFVCPHCPQRFTNNISRYNHIRFCHLKKTRPVGELKSFLCKLCGKIFSSHYELKRHNAGKHMPKSERPKFPCEKCNKSFLTRQSIGEHTCIDRFTCWPCRKQFKTLDELDLHKKIHFKEYLCQKCGRKFQKPYWLEHHKCRPKVLRKKPATPIVPMKDGGNPQVAEQVLELDGASVNRSKHGVEKQAVPTPAQAITPSKAFAGLDAPIKIESPNSDYIPFPIAEIKELNGNRQTNQEMTFFFKFEAGNISIIHP